MLSAKRYNSWLVSLTKIVWIAHAWSIDPGMSVGLGLLDAFRSRLRHLHVSSLPAELHHIPLTEEHEDLSMPLLNRCRDVPWILEAPFRNA